MNLITSSWYSIQDRSSVYWKNIPQNTSKQMLTSFASAFVLVSILRADPLVGLIAGSVSTMAVIIHALITPLFKHVIGNREELTWNEELCRGCIAMVGSSCVAAAFGELSILKSLYIDAIFYGLLISFKRVSRNISQSNWMCLYPLKVY